MSPPMLSLIVRGYSWTLSVSTFERILDKVGLSAGLVAAGREGSLMDIDADIDYTFHGDFPVKL